MWESFFSLTPLYGVFQGLKKLCNIVEELEKLTQSEHHNYFIRSPETAVLTLLFGMLIYIFLILLLEYLTLMKYKRRDKNILKTPVPELVDGMDPDVLAERHNVQENGGRGPNGEPPNVQFKALRKIYPNGFEAIRDLNLAIQKNEIFGTQFMYYYVGLLGPNGAGKSSTFNIATLGESRTEGECEILGCDISNVTEAELLKVIIIIIIIIIYIYIYIIVFDLPSRELHLE